MKFFLNRFIKYLQSTHENTWLTYRCSSKDLKQHCIIGHLFHWGAGQKKNEKRANRFCHLFEENIATTYMVFPVNDGEHPDYQQASPKERCIAYLKDLRDGKQLTTLDCLKQYESQTK